MPPMKIFLATVSQFVRAARRGILPLLAVALAWATPASAWLLERDDRGCVVPPASPVASPPALERRDPVAWGRVEVPASRHLSEDPCGTVWATELAFPGGDPDRPVRVSAAQSAAVRQALGGASASAFAVLPDELWFGSWNGVVARYRGGRWELLPSGPQTVTGFARHDGRIWLASLYLWWWDEPARSWRKVESTHTPVVHLLSRTGGPLLAARWNDVLALRHPDQPPVPFWKAPAGVDRIHALHPLTDGRLLVATDDGLFTLGKQGEQLTHELPGLSISAMATGGDGRLWVGTRGHGLQLRDGGSWRAWRYAGGLASDEVESLLVDRRGRLWAGIAGLWTGDEAALAKRLAAQQEPARLAVRRFPDACAAADALLASRPLSGEIAREVIDGVPHLFFGSYQACPDPHRERPIPAAISFRRADGATATVPFNGYRFMSVCTAQSPPDECERMRRHWSVTLALPQADGRQTRQPPPPAPTPGRSPVGAQLLDSRDRLWLGAGDSRLYRLDTAGWRDLTGDVPLLSDRNPVTAFAEDSAGNVWIGSSPVWDRARGRHSGSNLHRFDGNGWRHFSPDDGLGYWHTGALLPLRDGRLAVGTNGGVSLVDAAGRITTFKHGPMQGRVGIAAISEDAQGWLWITHGHGSPGITLFDGTRFTVVTTRQGLADDRIRRTAHDGEGRVWVLMLDGSVAVYDRQALLEAAG